MIKLNLCFEQAPGDKNSGVYIPATLNFESEEAANGERALGWPLGDESGIMSDRVLYLGWRLEVEDPVLTCLTLGFFPRLQVINFLFFVRS